MYPDGINEHWLKKAGIVDDPFDEEVFADEMYEIKQEEKFEDEE